jgi:membrane protein implicated in regulation of membrane protease activity
MTDPLRQPLFAAECGGSNTHEADMAQSSIWWVLAGAVIALELLSGTFYLLMLSLGLIGAAIAAHLGATLTVQLVVAAVVGGGFVLCWRRYKQQRPSALPASANRDVNLDVGETVQVEAWNPDGTGSVRYRGAHWDVSIDAGATPTAGAHRIVEVIGSRLVLRKL